MRVSQTLRFFILALVCVAFASTPATADSGNRQMEIIYSGDLTGELEPCGCSPTGNLGGLKRRATIIDQLLKKNPDTFITSVGGLLTRYSASEIIINKYILKGMALLNYDAIGLQKRDLSFGASFLNNTELPWVTTHAETFGFAESRTIEKGGQKLSFFSWLDTTGLASGNMNPDNTLSKDRSHQLEAAIHKAKMAGAITVLATTLSLEDAKKLISFNSLDILFKKASYETYGEPQLLGSTLILQPGSRGMYIGHIKLTLDQDNRISDFTHEVIALPTSVPDAPKMEQWYNAYNEAVKTDYQKRVEIRKKMKSGTSPFSGAKLCKTCHSNAHEIWKKSDHSRAYKSLSKVNRAFDPNCLICHTVGLNQDGGFIDKLLTPGLADVQCESCHGAARAHATAGGQTPTSNHDWSKEKVCAQCHNHAHSPLFNIEQYWSKIMHS